MANNHWQHQEFSFAGDIAQEVWGDGSAPVVFKDEAPVVSLGTLSPEAEAVCRHCLQILTLKMIKI